MSSRDLESKVRFADATPMLIPFFSRTSSIRWIGLDMYRASQESVGSLERGRFDLFLDAIHK